MQRVVGHTDILNTFNRAIIRSRLSHAYLFVGPQGVGKSTIARWLAQRLLCGELGNDGGAPCGRCPSCVHVERGMHPDVVRAGGAGSITIEAVREWTGMLAHSSLLGGWKVGILEGADTLTEAAANACLKSIEEPSGSAVLILTAPSPRNVLPTVRSRCAVIRCHRVVTADIAAALRTMGASERDTEELALLADGCPGRAIEWLQNPDARSSAAAQREFGAAVISASPAERLRHVGDFVDELPEDRTAARSRMQSLLDVFRLFARTLAARAVGCPDQGVRTPLPTLTLPDVIHWMDVLARAPKYLDANVTPRLVLEAVVLAFP